MIPLKSQDRSGPKKSSIVDATKIGFNQNAMMLNQTNKYCYSYQSENFQRQSEIVRHFTTVKANKSSS